MMERLLPMPLLLRVILVFTALFSCLALVIILASLAGRLDYSIGGYASNRDEWIRFALPVWVFLGATMGGIAYAIWSRRKWARHLTMLMWGVLGGYALALYVTGNLGLATVMSTLARVSIFGAFCLWYFYFKPNVVAYLASLA